MPAQNHGISGASVLSASEAGEEHPSPYSPPFPGLCLFLAALGILALHPGLSPAPLKTEALSLLGSHSFTQIPGSPALCLVNVPGQGRVGPGSNRWRMIVLFLLLGRLWGWMKYTCVWRGGISKRPVLPLEVLNEAKLSRAILVDIQLHTQSKDAWI